MKNTNFYAQKMKGSYLVKFYPLSALMVRLSATFLCRTDLAMPYLMGCHRGGGDWNKVYAMLEEIFVHHNVVLYRKDAN